MDNIEILLKNMAAKGALKSPKVVDAFRNVDRAKFLSEEQARHAYEDRDIPIASGQTITKPSTIASMIELLDLQPGEKVLNIGVGVCWTAAIISHIVGRTGSIVGTEIHPSLIDICRRNLLNNKIQNVHVYPATAVLGRIEDAPYDKIFAETRFEEFPEILLDQLNDNGAMVLPLKDKVIKYIKTGDTFEEIFTNIKTNFQPIIK